MEKSLHFPLEALGNDGPGRVIDSDPQGLSGKVEKFSGRAESLSSRLSKVTYGRISHSLLMLLKCFLAACYSCYQRSHLWYIQLWPWLLFLSPDDSSRKEHGHLFLSPPELLFQRLKRRPLKPLMPVSLWTSLPSYLKFSLRGVIIISDLTLQTELLLSPSPSSELAVSPFQ